MNAVASTSFAVSSGMSDARAFAAFTGVSTGYPPPASPEAPAFLHLFSLFLTPAIDGALPSTISIDPDDLRSNAQNKDISLRSGSVAVRSTALGQSLLGTTIGSLTSVLPHMGLKLTRQFGTSDGTTGPVLEKRADVEDEKRLDEKEQRVTAEPNLASVPTVAPLAPGASVAGADTVRSASDATTGGPRTMAANGANPSPQDSPTNPDSRKIAGVRPGGTTKENDGLAFGVLLQPKSQKSEPASDRKSNRPSAAPQQSASGADRSISEKSEPVIRATKSNGEHEREQPEEHSPAQPQAPQQNVASFSESSAAKELGDHSMVPGDASAPPATQHEMEAPHSKIPMTAAKQDLALKVGHADGPSVDIHVRERQGTIQVAVRGADGAMESTLRRNLPDLVQSLDRAGYDSKTYTNTAEFDAASARTGNAVSESAQSGFGDSRENDPRSAPSQQFAGQNGNHGRRSQERFLSNWADQIER